MRGRVDGDLIRCGGRAELVAVLQESNIQGRRGEGKNEKLVEIVAVPKGEVVDPGEKRLSEAELEERISAFEVKAVRGHTTAPRLKAGYSFKLNAQRRTQVAAAYSEALDGRLKWVREYPELQRFGQEHAELLAEGLGADLVSEKLAELRVITEATSGRRLRLAASLSSMGARLNAKHFGDRKTGRLRYKRQLTPTGGMLREGEFQPQPNFLAVVPAVAGTAPRIRVTLAQEVSQALVGVMQGRAADLRPHARHGVVRLFQRGYDAYNEQAVAGAETGDLRGMQRALSEQPVTREELREVTRRVNQMLNEAVVTHDHTAAPTPNGDRRAARDNNQTLPANSVQLEIPNPAGGGMLHAIVEVVNIDVVNDERVARVVPRTVWQVNLGSGRDAQGRSFIDHPLDQRINAGGAEVEERLLAGIGLYARA